MFDQFATDDLEAQMKVKEDIFAKMKTKGTL